MRNALLLAACIFALVAMACELDNQAKPQTTVDTPMGEAFHAVKNGWDITALAVNTNKCVPAGPLNLGLMQPKLPKGVYLCVLVELTNTGKEKHALGSDRFKLHDGMGREFEAEGFNDARTYDDISWGEDLNPGLSLRGILIFDVPREISGLWLETVGGGHITLGNVSNGQLPPAAGSGTAPQVPGTPTATESVHPPTMSPPPPPTPTRPPPPPTPTPRPPAVLLLTPDSGPPGSTVTVIGADFPPLVAVRGSIRSILTVDTITPDVNGAFKTSGLVYPAAALGPGTAEVCWEQLELCARAPFTVTAPPPASTPTPPAYHPSITFRPASGPVGIVVTVSGVGLEPNHTVTISSSGMTLGNAATDGHGNFVVSGPIPNFAIAGTTYRVQACTSPSVCAETTFAVTGPR